MSGSDDEQRAAELERLNKKRRVRRYRSLLLHWIAARFRRSTAHTIEPLPAVHRAQVSVTYIGHRSVLVRYAGVKLLCDPCLSNRVGWTPRESEAGIERDQLNDIDAVLISNADPSSLDIQTLGLLPRRALVVVPPGTAHHLASLGFDRVLEIAPEQSFQVKSVGIRTVEAARDTSPGLAFVLRGNGPTVFYCSSSAYSRMFTQVGTEFEPDLALLPIGGYSPSSFRRRAMSPVDALYAFEDLKARILVPISYGTFARSYEHISDPGEWLMELTIGRRLHSFVVQLRAGQSRIFTNPTRARRPTPYMPSDRAIELGGSDAVLAI